MKFIQTKIKDLIICEPKVFEDERGYFFESFNQKAFEAFIGKEIKFCQDNESKSSYGILRGLHFQKMPFTQSKLVRVIKGKVLDVVVDLREDSESFSESFSIELTEINKRQLFVPRGCAHAFIVLEEDTIFTYKVDNYYEPKYENGLIYNDKSLNIDWKIDSKYITLSDKDKLNDSLKNVYTFKGELYD